jgi:hypothetical protein
MLAKLLHRWNPSDWKGAHTRLGLGNPSGETAQSLWHPCPENSVHTKTDGSQTVPSGDPCRRHARQFSIPIAIPIFAGQHPQGDAGYVHIQTQAVTSNWSPSDPSIDTRAGYSV